jgi:hypothetical protein
MPQDDLIDVLRPSVRGDADEHVQDDMADAAGDLEAEIDVESAILQTSTSHRPSASSSRPVTPVAVDDTVVNILASSTSPVPPKETSSKVRLPCPLHRSTRISERLLFPLTVSDETKARSKTYHHKTQT